MMSGDRWLIGDLGDRVLWVVRGDRCLMMWEKTIANSKKVVF